MSDPSETNVHDTSGRSRIVANVVVSWVSQVLVIATGFLVPRIMDHKLGQEAVGVWDFGWAIVGYLSLSGFGIGSSLNRYVSMYRAENELVKLRTVVTTITVIQALLSLGVILVALALFFFLPRESLGDEHSQQTAVWVVLILGATVAVQFLLDPSRGILTGSHRWDIFNGLYSAVNLICSILMMVALWIGYGLITIALIYLSCAIVEGLIRVQLARRVCPEAKLEFSLASIACAKELTQYGIAMFTLSVAPALVSHSVKFLVAMNLGSAALAVYTRPASLLRHVSRFVYQFAFILTPMAEPIMSLEGRSKLHDFTVSCTKYGLAFCFPVIALLFVFGNDIIRLWMGERYVNGPLIAILTLGAILPLAQSPLTRVLIGLNLHQKLAYRSLFATALAFSGAMLWLQSAGHSLSNYALMSSVTLNLIGGMYIPWYAVRAMDLSLGRYLSEGFGKVLLICLPLSIGLYAARQMLPETWTYFILEGAVFSGLVALGYWYFLFGNSARRQILKRIPFASTA